MQCNVMHSLDSIP